MSFTRNKFNSKCMRCGVELKPGEGWVIPRYKGYEIICTTECLATNLRAPGNMKIEARVKIPQVGGVNKIDPYWRKAEFAVIAKMKEEFKGAHWAKIRSGNYNLVRGQDSDENGEGYCFVRATIRNVKNKNKREIIFNV